MILMDEHKHKDHELSVNVNLDTTPVLYTDSVSMTTNPDGVVLDVMQRIGNTRQARIVSRIGMSREHAKKFVIELEKLLKLTEGQSKTNEARKN